MDIFDYPKREAQIKKHCFTKLLDFTDYYRFLTLSPLLYLQKKSYTMLCNSFQWCHQESNRGHKDFQSFALPTELWHQGLQIC